MYDIYQKTLSKEVKLKGIGLHSGKASSVNVIPAKAVTASFFGVSSVTTLATAAFIADDMMLDFREEVERVLAGPGSFAQLKLG